MVKKLESIVDSLSISNEQCKEDFKLSAVYGQAMRERQNEMVRIAEIQDSIIHLQKEDISIGKEKLRKWKKTTLCTGVVAVGCIFAGVTGAWLPAVAVIAVTETAIIFTKKRK